MAATGNKSSLYPTVYKGDRGNAQRNGSENGAQVDLLNPVDSLAQDVSSTAVLMARPDEDDLVGEPQEPDDRGNWSGRFDFLMSLLGYSVGLGNVWRFPYLCYANGGGAFLFPFVLMLILVGFPLMFLELSFGQFAALGPAAIFDRICPLFYGLGYGMIAVSSMVSLYYTVIIGWAFLYMFRSFASELPWERCHPDWLSESCYSYLQADECKAINNSVYYQNICYNSSQAFDLNITELAKNKTQRSPPAQAFFEKDMLGMSGGIDEIGGVQWQVALCLLLAWSLTFLALSKGVQSVGKVVYFTALFPYVVLSILFVRGITLPGAKAGIIYYLTPDFEKLVMAKTWVAAAVQIFFALSPAWGGLITLSSYNKFHNDCFKDSLIVGVGNILTSIFAGFVIFPIIGYLAHELDMPVDKVVDQGPGLAFIVFPDVVTRLPISPLWSFLFFFMLITLGMGSEFALLETVMTAVQDTFPHLRQKKTYVVLCVCLLGFLGGLPICTEGGMYILQLMDTYAASWSVFAMAITECTIVGWIYGADNFIRDIEMMIGRKGTHWKRFFTVFWKFITPAVLMFLLFFNWIQYNRMAYAGKLYPVWAEIIGWVMAMIPIVLILSLSIYKLVRVPDSKSPRDRNFIGRVRRLLRHSDKWGPASKVPKFDLEEVQADGKTVTNPGFAASTTTRI
ncbi:sodium- and chloride-dependent glycine transporter 1-like isoform X2 [Littorina saxatilis]|uniref:Transporter n=1 Tax=Littorina saxatilis TaxID=31220 RepID=A0AAN9B3Z7_9CAEN